MDLKIKDVAELLRVSETTVRRWLADTKKNDRFPAYLINHQYRFNREEVERWVMRRRQGLADEGSFFLEESHPQAVSSGSLQFSLYRALHKGAVVDHIPGKTKAEVIRATMDRVADSLELDAEGVAGLLLDRERLQPTALGYGMALPHTRDFLLNRAYDIVVVAYLDEPIDFEALDGQPVQTLFFLFASDDRRHLHLLAKTAYLVSQPSARQMLGLRPDKDSLLEYIKQWESSIQKK